MCDEVISSAISFSRSHRFLQHDLFWLTSLPNFVTRPDESLPKRLQYTSFLWVCGTFVCLLWFVCKWAAWTNVNPIFSSRPVLSCWQTFVFIAEWTMTFLAFSLFFRSEDSLALYKLQKKPRRASRSHSVWFEIVFSCCTELWNEPNICCTARRFEHTAG